MYQIGDYVVKVNNGVCKVADIVTMDQPVAMRGKRYYLMVPYEDASAKVYVPVEGKNDNVRIVMSGDEARAFIGRIPDIQDAEILSEKVREQEYKNAIRSGSPDRLMGIIKNIYKRCQNRMAQGKKSTTIDERYYKQAENILYSELAFALGCEKSEVTRMISDTVGVDIGIKLG